MQAYRDAYASLFQNGQGVVLIGISSDTPEDLAAWARDDDFQFLMGSDPGSKTYAAFGGNPRENGSVGSRAVIVIDVEGRIADVVPAFNPADPMDYEHLGEVVDRLAPEPDARQQ